MDDRRRVPVPPEFRGALEGEPIIMYPGLEGCVQVYTLSGFVEENRELHERTSANKQIRNARRRAFQLGRRQDKLDSQGRVTLDVGLVQHAHLQKDIRVIGAGPYFEIWDRPTIIAVDAELEADYEATLQEISEEDVARRRRGERGPR